MNFKKLSKTILAAAFLTLSACGSSDSVSNPAGPAIENPVGQNPTVPTLPDLTSIISGGIADKTQVMFLDQATGELLLRLPLSKSLNFTIPETPVSQIPGARLYTSTSSDGSKYVVLAIPLKYILRDVPQLPVAKLPNGDALPMLGQLPAVEMVLNESNKIKARVYVGLDAVGVFVETSFNPYLAIDYDILNKVQQQIGTFSFIPAKATYQGGFFLGMKLPETLAKALAPFIK